MQIAQRCYGHPRVTEFHRRALDWIEHPCRHYPHYTSTRFNMNKAAAASLLDVSNFDATAVHRMPTIMDFHVLSDMGRMTGHWSSHAKASCLPIQLLAHMRVRIFIRWSSQQKPTASIRIAISPGCSSGCLWQRRSTTTTRCFPGSCRPTYADPRSHHMSHAPPPELRGVADGPHTDEAYFATLPAIKSAA
jgi:hypothetical protein